MTTLTALQVMQDGPVIPVIVLRDTSHALPLARALLAGGLRMLEITLRTPQALACIEMIAKELPDVAVGAGTVRNPGDVMAARRCGARFLVSPGFTRDLSLAAHDAGLPLLPGVATGSEIMTAMDLGHTEFKFFPAAQAGGAAMLKAWSGPFAEARFCPTGGITATNAPDYLALPNVSCVGGSWLVPADALARQDWAAISALASAAVQLRR